MLEISHGPILDYFSSLPICAGVEPDYDIRTAVINPEEEILLSTSGKFPRYGQLLSCLRELNIVGNSGFPARLSNGRISERKRLSVSGLYEEIYVHY